MSNQSQLETVMGNRNYSLESASKATVPNGTSKRVSDPEEPVFRLPDPLSPLLDLINFLPFSNALTASSVICLIF